MILLKIIFFLLSILLNIAFFTLFERKILGYIQIRKGPNLVGLSGILQPFSDGIKLFLKQSSSPRKISLYIYKFMPFLFFLLRLILWARLFFWNLAVENNFLFIIRIRRFSALIIFLVGWGRSSKYSLLGGIRASAQIISYEVIFSFIFLGFLVFFFNFNFNSLMLDSEWQSIGFLIFPFLSVILIIILAETNRTPFDLTEGESELVRGFNTEFASIDFVFLFLGEYSFICFFSFMLRIFTFGLWEIFIFIQFFFIWRRASFPRKRYDNLINLIWIWLFPIVCSWLLVISLFLLL